MMNISNIEWKAMSDVAILLKLGEYIKYHRLEQNKSQDQLAKEAGINRSTLIEFEKGNRSNTLTLIQLLRALDLLHVLDEFKIQHQLSPIQLAKIEQQKRKRASKSKMKGNITKSEW